jgi:translation initiation factor IF-2
MMEKSAVKTVNSELKPGTRVPRPPVVVVVGHVDHGKTTLLDYIRKSNVAGREAGGITQATTAYEIEVRPKEGTPPSLPRNPSQASHQNAMPSLPLKGEELLERGGTRKITFVDTPGHEAFGAMRTRGARVADLAVLVVSAEEGVKPQTKEAIDILNQTKTPFVVAFTKIDRTGGNIDKARNDLMTAGVLLEGFGGQVSYHGVSGKSGEGIDELLDLLLLSADMEELTYDPSAPATGFVLEARREPQRGVEAILILKDGTLHRGDPIATPSASGKVKILEDFAGQIVGELTPSAPAIVIGLESLPKVGEEFVAGPEPKFQSTVSLPASAADIRSPKSKTGNLPLILKASDSGSLEALAVVLQSIEGAAEKGLRIVDSGVGEITDGDVKQAVAMGATIVGFKNRVEKAAQSLAEAHSVRLITSKIVYDLLDAVNGFLAEQTSPIAGELEVLAVFGQVKLEKQLVGGRVTSGMFKPKTRVELYRPAGPEAPVVPLVVGKVLTMHEKKSEIFQAEKGKEIGVVVSFSTLVQVGDRLVIKK